MKKGSGSKTLPSSNSPSRAVESPTIGHRVPADPAEAIGTAVVKYNYQVLYLLKFVFHSVLCYKSKMALFVNYRKVDFDLFCYMIFPNSLSHISASQHCLTPTVHFLHYHAVLLLLVWISLVTYTQLVNRWNSYVVSNNFFQPTGQFKKKKTFKKFREIKIGTYYRDGTCTDREFHIIFCKHHRGTWYELHELQASISLVFHFFPDLCLYVPSNWCQYFIGPASQLRNICWKWWQTQHPSHSITKGNDTVLSRVTWDATSIRYFL